MMNSSGSWRGGQITAHGDGDSTTANQNTLAVMCSKTLDQWDFMSGASRAVEVTHLEDLTVCVESIQDVYLCSVFNDVNKAVRDISQH